jgi:HSP20 family protein
MNKVMSKPPVERAEAASLVPKGWRPLEGLRKEVDRLFQDFDPGFWRTPMRHSIFDIEPFWRRELSWGAVPPVDVVENDRAYEITAELPGLDEKDIAVKYGDGTVTIKGEKKEETEEKKQDFYLSERHFGSFERSFRVPESVDADKIEAKFKNGVLTLVLPKKPEAQSHEKKIFVKAA